MSCVLPFINLEARTDGTMAVCCIMQESAKKEDGTEYNLKTGHYYYCDVTKAHAVRNTSDVDRIHLVADCYSNEKMRALLN